MRELPLLENLLVAAPCPAEWDKMRGDDRVRHCASCDLQVYSFAEMTRAEIAALVAEKEGGRLCGQLYRRADGTLLTKDCPVGLHVRMKRATRRAGLALAALLGLGINSFAQGDGVCGSSDKQKCNARGGRVEVAQLQTPESNNKDGLTLSGFACDPNDAIIPDVTIKLRNRSTKKSYKAETNSDGYFNFRHLVSGVYMLGANYNGKGFEKLKLENIRIGDGQSLELKIFLDLSNLTVEVGMSASNKELTISGQDKIISANLFLPN